MMSVVRGLRGWILPNADKGRRLQNFADVMYGAPPEAVGIGVGGPSGWSLTEAPFILSGPSF